MTVYARNDISSVTISTGHGGCGKVHSRPVSDGAPAKQWSLTCATCEDRLRSDPLWSTFPTNVPETPDEQSLREEHEKRGQRDQAVTAQQAQQAMAQMPDAFREFAAALATGQGKGLVPLEQVNCPNGHLTPSGAKFCIECGSPISIAETDPAPVLLSAPSVPVEVENETPPPPVKTTPPRRRSKPADG